MAGAALGIIAGVIDVAVGASIRDWVGDKLDTSTLGVGTIALSSIALAAAIAWQRPGGPGGGRRPPLADRPRARGPRRRLLHAHRPALVPARALAARRRGPNPCDKHPSRA